MFQWYGMVGVVLIAFAELNFFLKLEPFATKYFIIIWGGYILTIDALVYKLRGKSFFMNSKYQFFGLFGLSALFWWVFEFVNVTLGNWNYNGVGGSAILTNIGWKTIYFSTVLPALFETYELIRSVHLFDKVKLHRKHKISKVLLGTLVGIGVICFILPLIYPTYAYPLVWVTFFFILDPINYLNKQPSIIAHLKDRKLVVPLSLMLAGITVGVLWEFWNYWAINKWYYNIPYLGFFKIFEMPILGYLGYFPFALELYAMYWFVRSLFLKKEPLLIE
jgi:hypothetical protein